MVNEGIEPKNLLNDILEIIYFIQQTKNLGSFDNDLSLSESERDVINSISKMLLYLVYLISIEFISNHWVNYR